jgi:phosphohistidine phosphatase
MKTLLLLRHAKSSHKDEKLRDIDRPLNERGIADAKLIGALIRKKKVKPDLVLASPAERARQTADLALKSARVNVELKFDERIYEATSRALLKVVREINDTANTVILIGHNPGLEELLEKLTGEAPRLPTASLTRIELGLERWSEVQTGAGHLEYRVKPKELRAVKASRGASSK